MTVQLTVDDPTAARLRKLAAQRGLTVEDLARQALAAGMDALDRMADGETITWLGPIHSSPPTAEQIVRMPSPIIALGPIPTMTLTERDGPPADRHRDAD